MKAAPRRRTILRVIALLLAWGAAGAALNVAVAWGALNLYGIWRDSFASNVVLQPKFLPPGSYLPEYVGETVHVWAGWPWKCVGSEYVYDDRRYLARGDAAHEFVRDFDRSLLFPSRLTGGFAINTLFYAGVLWVLICGPFALRRMIRRRRGQCAQCAYPIGQNERCTECGAAATPKAVTA